MIFRLSLCAAAALSLAAPASAQWSGGGAGAASGGLASVGGPSPVNDAKGDAQNALNAGPPLLDIDTIDVRYGAGTLDFSMTFFTEIAPPDPGAINGVVGYIQLDVDQDAATGGTPVQNVFSPPFLSLAIGVEFSILLFESPGQPRTFAIVNDGFDTVGFIPATYTGTSLSGSVPLALLGYDDGLVDFTSIVGTIPQPTDALDVIGTSVPVPEPGTLALVGIVPAFVGRRVCAAVKRHRLLDDVGWCAKCPLWA